MTPAISLISICFENPNELHSTLLSCEGLDRANYEVVVVDGSRSTTRCQDVLKAFPWARCVFEADTGRYNAMNKGVAVSRGAAVMMLNSGDVLVDKAALDRIVASHRNELDSSIIYGDTFYEILGKQVLVQAPTISSENLRRGDLPCHQSVIVPTWYVKAHPYNERLVVAADTEFLRRAFAELTAIYVPAPLSIFQFGGASNSPSGWRDLCKQYRETIGVRELTKAEAFEALLSIFGRKLFADVFGKSAMQRVQLRRALRRSQANSSRRSKIAR